MKLFCNNYWQNPKITATVHYFHFNSHCHYHYHHFHYHWKMHLYHLKILLTILFIVIWSPICFNLSSFTSTYFSLVLFQAFHFLCPVKGLRISLQPSDILDVFLYLLFLSIVISTSLHSPVYTYLHLLIHTCVLFRLLYKFDKIDKIWKI